jgi:hypothetical protein
LSAPRRVVAVRDSHARPGSDEVDGRGCIIGQVPSPANCLSGKSANHVQPHLKKYSDFQNTQISLSPSPSRPTEGRLAIVTNAGRDAVDAAASARSVVAGRSFGIVSD